MALYTGIEMYKKVKDVEDWVLPHVRLYGEHFVRLEYHESQGGYPNMEDMFDLLNICYACDYDNSDEAYYALHTEYMKYINKIEYIVQQIDKYDLKNKIENKQVCFITRNYPLAHQFGEIFNFPQFYYRKIIEVEKLIKGLQEINIKMHDKLKNTIESSCKIISEHKNEWVFEVHVS